MAENRNTLENLTREDVIRARIALNRIKRAQVAAELEVSEMTFYRWMKDPTEEHLNWIEAAVDTLIREREAGADE